MHLMIIYFLKHYGLKPTQNVIFMASHLLLFWEHELFDASLINPQRACAEGYSSQLNLCVCVCLSDASNAR